MTREHFIRSSHPAATPSAPLAMRRVIAMGRHARTRTRARTIPRHRRRTVLITIAAAGQARGMVFRWPPRALPSRDGTGAGSPAGSWSSSPKSRQVRSHGRPASAAATRAGDRRVQHPPRSRKRRTPPPRPRPACRDAPRTVHTGTSPRRAVWARRGKPAGLAWCAAVAGGVLRQSQDQGRDLGPGVVTCWGPGGCGAR
jgi:hypothetical protein